MSYRVPSAESTGELSSPLGRYSIAQAISVGEVASVHLGLLEGAEGFRKTVAIKRLIAGLEHEQAALAELTYEACVGALIHHPNVVSVIDLGQVENGPFLVMEYVLGETVAGLLRASGRCPVPIAVAIVADALRGLHAAHFAEDAAGAPLEIVHRNVSPDNILVGVDGTARVIDFGSSVSALDSMTIPNRQRWTRRACITSPEQLMGWPADGRADVFAAAVVLWQLVAGVRPFRNHGAEQAFLSRPARSIPPASAFNMDVSPEFEAVIERALSWSPRRRFESAAQFAEELEAAVAPSSRNEVAGFVESVAATRLAVQRKLLSAMDAPYGRISTPPPPARHMVERAVPFARESSPSEPSLDQMVVPRVEAFKSKVAGAFRRSRREGPSLSIGPRWIERAKKAMIQQGSTVLASLSLLCLLMAGTRASLDTHARSATPVRSSVLAHTVNLHADEECPPIESAQRALPPAQPLPPFQLRPIAPPAASPSLPELAVREKPVTVRDRPKRAPVRRAAPAGERLTCVPPFTIDGSGIRRIKPNCL